MLLRARTWTLQQAALCGYIRRKCGKKSKERGERSPPRGIVARDIERQPVTSVTRTEGINLPRYGRARERRVLRFYAAIMQDESRVAFAIVSHSCCVCVCVLHSAVRRWWKRPEGRTPRHASFARFRKCIMMTARLLEERVEFSYFLMYVVAVCITYPFIEQWCSFWSIRVNYFTI